VLSALLHDDSVLFMSTSPLPLAAVGEAITLLLAPLAAAAQYVPLLANSMVRRRPPRAKHHA